MKDQDNIVRGRFPWTGGLSDDEKAQKGAQLIAWLHAAANSRGLTLREMSEALGVTYGYIAQIRSGIRSASNVSSEFAHAAARFLGVPPIAVMLAAGRVEVADFYDDPDRLAVELERAMQFIAQDPDWGALVPLEAHGASAEMQHMIVVAYEKATGRQLLSGRVDSASILSIPPSAARTDEE